MRILQCIGASTRPLRKVRGSTEQKGHRKERQSGTRNYSLPHGNSGPVYITCAVWEFHTWLMNQTEYLLQVIYFLLSITSQPRHSLNLKPNRTHFFHPPLTETLLSVTARASIRPTRETKKHPRLENSLSNYLSSLSWWAWQNRGPHLCIS